MGYFFRTEVGVTGVAFDGSKWLQNGWLLDFPIVLDLKWFMWEVVWAQFISARNSLHRECSRLVETSWNNDGFAHVKILGRTPSTRRSSNAFWSNEWRHSDMRPTKEVAFFMQRKWGSSPSIQVSCPPVARVWTIASLSLLFFDVDVLPRFLFGLWVEIGCFMRQLNHARGWLVLVTLDAFTYAIAGGKKFVATFPRSRCQSNNHVGRRRIHEKVLIFKVARSLSARWRQRLKMARNPKWSCLLGISDWVTRVRVWHPNINPPVNA